MRKSFALCIIAALVAISTYTSCTRPAYTNGVAYPNISNLSIQSVGTFVKGASTLITLASSTLADGYYHVTYSITGANHLVDQVATLAMSGGFGTFSTEVLDFSGSNTITIKSIANSGGPMDVTSGNTATFFDSTGLVTADVSGTSGGPTTFRATYVQAHLTGSMLTINAVMWTPWLTTIDLVVYSYTSGQTGTIYFNKQDLSTSSPTSTFNATTSYGVAGNGVAIANIGQWGSITITGTSPTLTGSFQFKNGPDSSMVSSGVFNCPHY